MKTYTIRKGWHYSGFRFRLHTGIIDYIVTAKFHDNCWYKPQTPSGKNKLCGFTEGIFAI